MIYPGEKSLDRFQCLIAFGHVLLLLDGMAKLLEVCVSFRAAFLAAKLNTGNENSLCSNQLKLILFQRSPVHKTTANFDSQGSAHFVI